MIYIITTISFLLDGLLSNFMPYNLNNISSFTPLFTVISLVLIYPLFNNQNKYYLVYAFLLGIIYDLTYTDTMLFNGMLFLIIAYIIKFIYAYFVDNIYNSVSIGIVILTLYIIISYGVLSLLNYVEFNIVYLFYKIIKTIILNVLYNLVSYFIIDKITKKFKIKRIT